MPGGTPKKTAQVEEPRLRPRKCPGHSKVSGEATGTRPRFLEASHGLMLASPFVGTSETSMSSMCATHALSEVSLRLSAGLSTGFKVPLPFACHPPRVQFFGARVRAARSNAPRPAGPARGLL